MIMNCILKDCKVTCLQFRVWNRVSWVMSNPCWRMNNSGTVFTQLKIFVGSQIQLLLAAVITNDMVALFFIDRSVSRPLTTTTIVCVNARLTTFRLKLVCPSIRKHRFVYICPSVHIHYRGFSNLVQSSAVVWWNQSVLSTPAFWISDPELMCFITSSIHRSDQASFHSPIPIFGTLIFASGIFSFLYWQFATKVHLPDGIKCKALISSIFWLFSPVLNWFPTENFYI